MKKIRNVIALLLSLSMLSISVAATESSNINQVEDYSLSFNEARLLVPTSTVQARSVLLADRIDFQIAQGINNHGTATGAVVIGEKVLPFSVSGEIRTVTYNGAKLFFATMNGICDNLKSTLVVAADNTNNCTFTAITIGSMMLGETPVEYTFGKMPENCGSYYAMCAAQSSNVSECETLVADGSNVQSRLSTDNAEDFDTVSYYLPNGDVGIKLTGYAPSTAMQGTSFTIAAKITSDSDVIDDYLVSLDDTAYGASIKNVTFETGSAISRELSVVEHSPTTMNQGTMEIPVPYMIVGWPPSFEVEWITHHSLSIDAEVTPSTGPSAVIQEFNYSSTYTTAWANVDWESCGPAESATGIGVDNLFTKVNGSGDIDIYAQASVILGYYTRLANGRVQYHTVSLGEKDIGHTVTVRSAP